jgi:hypothetical protein
MRGRIYKDPLKKYNNKKINAYLIQSITYIYIGEGEYIKTP